MNIRKKCNNTVSRAQTSRQISKTINSRDQNVNQSGIDDKKRIEKKKFVIDILALLVALISLSITVFFSLRTDQREERFGDFEVTQALRNLKRDATQAALVIENATQVSRNNLLNSTLQVIDISRATFEVSVQETSDEQMKKMVKPNIVPYFYIADSPDLTSEKDQIWLSQIGLNKRVIPISYISGTLDIYAKIKTYRNLNYLFIMFRDDGLGNATNVLLEEVVWIPKEGVTKGFSSRTDGNVFNILNDIVAVGTIKTGDAVFLLVDRAKRLGYSNPTENSNALAICIKYSYTSYLEEDKKLGSSSYYCLPGSRTENVEINIEGYSLYGPAIYDLPGPKELISPSIANP